MAALSVAHGQELTPGALPRTLDRTPATLHGVVRNASTGEGLARALVRIEGDADAGVLTDGAGRFEISGIPVGPQAVEVRKPGFRDRGQGGGSGVSGENGASTHNVMVAAQMADVVFTLALTCAIHGQVELSTGDAGQGITISLARRTVEAGRAVWQAAGSTKTHSDGTYRFAGLADGVYAIFSQPAMESELDAVPGPAGAGERRGYPSVYYPDARDPAGEAKISLSNGQEALANLTLTREAFQTVRAETILPGGARYGSGNPAWAGMNLSAMLMDAQGLILPYAAQFDEQTQTVQALVPDGTYSLLVTVTTSRSTAGAGGNASYSAAMDAGPFTGSVDFSVTGHAPPNLRVPLSAQRPNSVPLSGARSGGEKADGNGSGTIMVLVNRASGWIDDAIASAYANGRLPGPLHSVYTPPGAYWVHTNIGQKGLCESSYTAGGANLGSEPLIVGLSGSTAPMELALRDDCAALQISLPESQAGIVAGEEIFYTVYVVPDFDFTTDLTPVTLRPSSGGSVTVEDLTPGGYHVYAFAGEATLEYRNRDALAALTHPGQAVTLSAGATGTIVVEAQER